MSRKLLLLSIGFVLILAVVLVSATAGDRLQALTAKTQLGEFQQDVDRAYCNMYKCNPSVTSITYFSGFASGMSNVTYFDPTDLATAGCAVAAAYPFEITALNFPLFEWTGANAQWPVTVDVVVFDMAVAGDISAGPGTELCRQTATCAEAVFSSTWGTVAFSVPCCVSGPFFIGIEYNDPGAGPFPSIILDDLTPTLNDNWFYYSGAWNEWNDIWTAPIPGYPLLTVDGETVSQNCAGDPWANHKMHFPQLPDEEGWDVHVDNPMFLADDWTCSETGPVTDIHWWGSWLDEAEGIINEFTIKIWADVPADELDPLSYSHPGVLLQTIYAPAQSFEITAVMPTDLDLYEGWYDPSAPLLIDPDHQEYFRYDLILSEQDWFYQEEGTIYWLSIEADIEDQGLGQQWGWKNSQNHHEDDAVYWDGDGWVDIYEPGELLQNWFEISLNETGVWVGGYGAGAYKLDPADPFGGWYYYEEAEPGWWNVWFWDHPLDPERQKDIWINYTVVPYNAQFPELYAEVTPNWATDIWTLDGMPPGDPRPPLPGDFDYTTTPPTPPEDDWIGRGDPPDIWQSPTPEGRYFMRIPDYNPEWVSVDVRGFNVHVEGTIYHMCRSSTSLDLAFVITSDFEPEPEGACCFPDPTGTGTLLCVVTTATDCGQNLFGTYQGDGTTCGGSIEACCLPDGSCIMADTYCCTNDLGGTPQGASSTCTAPEACCFTDGTCLDIDPLCCIDQGGTPQGAGTDCSSVDCSPEPEGACCFDDPTGTGTLLCVVTTATDCGQNLGGTYQGNGTTCGGSIEACCLSDGSCINADTYCCVNDLGGTPQGAGSSCTSPIACCLPDGRCQMLDPLCCVDLGGTVQAGAQCSTPEACCFTDGTCQDLDPLCCIDQGGTPQGAGTDCSSVDCNPEPEGACCYTDPPSPDLYCIVTTQTYCEQTLGGTYQGDDVACGGSIEACCLNDGSCIMADILCCQDIGGTPQGAGTDCATTTCEVIPEQPKNWYQPPDLSERGMDVNATYPYYVLADDFQCTKTEPITEIHVWGSWFNDVYPGGDPPSIAGDPGNVRFHLSIHADIPATQTEYSKPGDMLTDWIIEPGDFGYKRITLDGDYEGWFNPPSEWFPDGDQNCWEYIFEFDESNWFEQQGTDAAPIIYWLDVQAIIPAGVSPALFGWKTSTIHWNDDAVWFDGEDVPQQLPWFEMRYPEGHPNETESVDQAFLIGGPCDCEPGEANGVPGITILDVVYIINYKYKEGPDPIPYPLCSADPDCNCDVTILDVVYIINYKYKNGPPPCTCGNFLVDCPGGLR